MRIKAFSFNIEANELEDYNLKNCSVVIDGQNYFYNLYQRSGIPFQFGCESDKYADYLREHLSIYKKANVKCYVILKGGHADETTRLRIKERFWNGPSYDASGPQDEIVLPVFMKSVYKEVLDEMKIDYVMCEFESKKQCIALAQKLKCPIISYDIEFAFSGVPYIPYKPPLDYETRTRSIRCGIFNLGNFINKYGISREKLALFIVLTDENIFPALFFQPLLERERIFRYNHVKRNQEIIKWLSRNTVDQALRKVLQMLSSEERLKLEDEHTKMLKLIGSIETLEAPVEYLMNGKCVSFKENDPHWFEKGVIANHIALPYINLYHSNALLGSWCIEDLDADDSLFFSIEIIKYAFNLLTNYQRDSITFHNTQWGVKHVDIRDSKSVQQPPYEALNSPFENGWDGIKSFKLFDHFLEESLPDVSFVFLLDLPKDARLLMLSLVYFSRRKEADTAREVYAILLSYVMLGAVFPKLKNDNINNESDDPENTKSFNNLVVADCNKACSILEPFFKLSRGELIEIFDRKLIHAFVEFQHCLYQMNNLNTLCGRCFEPTILSKTYNATFVYRVFYSMKNKSGEEALNTLKKMLTPAPTVLNCFLNLVNVYEQTMKS